jgi:hypothetical protein
MKSRDFRIAAVVGASILICMPLHAHAQSSVVVKTYKDTNYLNGGVGEQEQTTIRRLGKDFPLRMIFSEGTDGEFIADVAVTISDARGNPVFELQQAGPLLDVMLPNGQYKVSARFKELTETQEVALSGKDGKDLSFHWKVK